MFIGHFALGFAAKKLNPKPSLGTYFLAVQFLDLIWPSLLLLNVEKVEINPDASAPVPLSFTHYPVSHSLVTVIGWSLLLGGLYFLFRKNKNAALVVGFGVLSHWLLDLLVHLPDLPLYPGNSPLYGLGLWKFKLPELLLELVLFAVGIAVYFKTTAAKNGAGTYITISLIAFLLLVHVMNIFGPPPPDVNAIAWAGQSQWLLVAWGYWADSKRVDKRAPGEKVSSKQSKQTTVAI